MIKYYDNMVNEWSMNNQEEACNSVSQPCYPFSRRSVSLQERQITATDYCFCMNIGHDDAVYPGRSSYLHQEERQQDAERWKDFRAKEAERKKMEEERPSGKVDAEWMDGWLKGDGCDG